MNGILSVFTLRSFGKYVLVAVPLLLACLLSPTALIALGIDYVVPGGSPIAKIHPAAYCAAASLLLFLCTGFSQKIYQILFSQRYSLQYYFMSILVLFIYTASFLAVPFMHLIDIWVFSGIVIILIDLLEVNEKWLLARTLDLFMIVNSLLGFLEVGTNWRLVPITQWSVVLGQWVYPHEWRATAFLGHPLTNSYVVGSYVLSLLITNRIKQMGLRLPLVGFHIVALCAFGSRGALAFLVAGLLIYIGTNLVRTMLTGRIAEDVLGYIVVLVPTIVVFIPLVLASGFADRYIDRFTNDGGSAEARNIGFELISELSPHDLFYGVPTALIGAILKRYNLVAIESFWLSFLTTFGLVGCIIFFPFLYRMCQNICANSNPRNKYILIYFFLCCSTSQSIASKGPMMAVIVAICMTNLDYSVLWSRRSRVNRVYQTGSGAFDQNKVAGGVGTALAFQPSVGQGP